MTAVHASTASLTAHRMLQRIRETMETMAQTCNNERFLIAQLDHFHTDSGLTVDDDLALNRSLFPDKI